MKRLFEIFHRELRGVHEAAFLLAAATVASNILGLVRDRLLASRFGAGLELDIYYASFRIPDLLYTLSIFFVASTAIIPQFLDAISSSKEEARRLENALFTIFLGVMAVVLVVAWVVMPFLTPILVPGFDQASQESVVTMSRILLLSPLFLGLSNLFSSILQSFRRFFMYAASFLFYNLGIIMGILFFVPRFGLMGIAWGVALGAFFHLLIQAPVLMRMGFLPWFTFTFPSRIYRIFQLSLPRSLGLAANQFAFLAITSIASTLGLGSIAVFNLSYNLQSIPLSVIGLSYSVAAFPTMAELIVKKERKVFFEHLASAARHIIFWTLPLAVLFIVLRAQIVRSILGAGAFGWADTRLTAASLALFSLGIVAQSLTALFVRAFYAIERTKIPVVLNIFSMIFTISLAFFLVEVFAQATGIAGRFAQILRVEDVENISMLGLPLAFALGSMLNTLLLGLSLGWVEGEFRGQRIAASLIEIFISSVLAGGVSYAALQVLAPVFDLNTFLGIFLQGLFAGLFGIVSAGIFLSLSGNKEFKEIKDAFHKKFWKKGAIASELERM